MFPCAHCVLVALVRWATEVRDRVLRDVGDLDVDREHETRLSYKHANEFVDALRGLSDEEIDVLILMRSLSEFKDRRDDS